MEDSKEREKNEPETEDNQVIGFWQRRKKVIGVVSLSVFVILALTGGGVAATETYHKDRVFHGVSIGGLAIGGLTKKEAQSVLENWHDQWWNDQLQYRILDENGSVLTEIEFLPIIVSEESGQSHQFISYDLEMMLEQAYAYGRDTSLVKRLFNQAISLVNEQEFSGVVQLDKEQLQDVLQVELQELETLPQDATLVFASADAEPEISKESAGNTFNYAEAIDQTYQQLLNLKSQQVDVKRTFSEPVVIEEDVKKTLSQLDELKTLFPLEVNYFDTKIDFGRDWNIQWSDVFNFTKVILQDDQPTLGFDLTSSENFWEQFESVINKDSVDAKFEITEDGKVKQFQPSENGYTVNREETNSVFNSAIASALLAPSNEESSTSVTLAVDIAEAKVPTADVNDLGITEVLGVGYSDFSGSPRNRIHNISVGASKLDGLLIEPGEEFSLVQALKPFTISEGYLPELVIKGDKIEPEIGGGLCQIGSTTFRAAMKSGLPIVERRNHSLVVSYYNDPRNGNPGTDATIYDASPDFKFTNDTGNSILIKTDMNASTGDLYFTFWGTNDGREADYTEPVVHRWIGTGPTKIVETTELAPGQKKCQAAHPGAETSFTYTVKGADGEVHEEVFKSSYRPLPTICLVGVDPNAPKELEDGDASEGVVTTDQTEEQVSDIEVLE